MGSGTPWKTFVKTVCRCICKTQGMGNLYIFEGTINTKKYKQVLEQHMLPSGRCLFQGRPCLFEQEIAKPQSVLQCSFDVKENGF